MGRPPWSCRTTSRSCRCRHAAPSSTRSKTCGSSCATTGSQTGSSNPTRISSTTAATLGTNSSINLGASCPSDCANGHMGTDQCTLVLFATSPAAELGLHVMHPPVKSSRARLALQNGQSVSQRALPTRHHTPTHVHTPDVKLPHS